MGYLSRFALIMAAPLAIAALAVCVTPAGAGLSANGISTNGISMNGSGLADLNGIAVEAVILPDVALR